MEKSEVTRKPEPLKEIVVIKHPDTLHAVKSERNPSNSSTQQNPEASFERTYTWNQPKSKPKNQQPSRFKCTPLLSFYRLPMILRYFIYAITGSFILMIPGIISYNRFIKKSEFKLRMEERVDDNGIEQKYQPEEIKLAIMGAPLYMWSIFFSALWFAWFALLWAYTSLPLLMKRILDLKNKTVSSIDSGTKINYWIEHLRALQVYLALVTCTLFGWGLWDFIFHTHETSQVWMREHLDYMNRFWMTLFIVATTWAIVKLLLSVFSFHFHRRVYKQRICENNDRYHILTVLFTVQKDKKKRSDKKTDKKDKVEEEDDFLDFSWHVFTGMKQVFKAAIGFDIGAPKNSIPLRSEQDARTLAKLLFKKILLGTSDQLIHAHHFRPFFQDANDAICAFESLDMDGNGSINKKDMEIEVLDIYNARQHLEQSMQSSSQAMDKLDTILKSLMFILIFFIVMTIWEVDNQQFMTSMISIWAGLIFAFGGVLKEMFESCIFLFITHPYDVGDRVDIENESYIVTEFGIMTTTLRRIDGTEIYAPNIQLLTKFIHNVRRSGNQAEIIDIIIAYTTPQENIDQLQEHMFNYIVKNSRDFIPKLEITIKSIVDKDWVMYSMRLEHKGNWDDEKKKLLRKTKFMNELKDAIIVHNVPLM